MTDRVAISSPQSEAKTQLPLGLTYGDLARIGLPAALGGIVAGIPGLAVAGLAGFAVAKAEVKGATADVHAWHAAQHVAGTRLSTWYDRVDGTGDAVLLENGTVVGLVEVGSVDVTYLSDAETAANLATVTDFLKTVDYPATLVSGQRTVHLADTYAVNDAVQTADHYVIIPAFQHEADSVAERQALVDRRCSAAVDALTAADMHADRADLAAEHPVVDRLMAEPDSIGVRGYESDGQCRRVLRITDFPGEVATAWLADLLDLDVPGTVDVVQRIDPVDDDDMSWLQRKWQVATAEQAAAGTPSRVQAMSAVADDIQELLTAQTSGEPLLDYSVYLVVSGPSWDIVDESVDRVRRHLTKHRITARVPWFRINTAAQVVTGLAPDTLSSGHIVAGQSVAAGFPWAATDTVEEDGVVFGRDTDSGRPVVLDRFGWEAGHVARMGKIGSGKSFAAKLELVRCLHRYDELQVVVVDPKQEYGFIADGDWDNRTTQLTVDDRSADNTAALVDHVRTAYQHGHQYDGKTLVVVDEAHRLLNDDEGRQVLGELIREGRDQAIAVTVVTQTAADFTQSREGRNILKNIDCYVFMRHQDVTTSVEDFFDLSPTEAARLRKLRTGTHVGFSEGIIRGPMHGVLRVEPSDGEARVIGEPAAAEPRRDDEERAVLSMPDPESPAVEGDQSKELPDELRPMLQALIDDVDAEELLHGFFVVTVGMIIVNASALVVFFIGQLVVDQAVARWMGIGTAAVLFGAGLIADRWWEVV